MAPREGPAESTTHVRMTWLDAAPQALPRRLDRGAEGGARALETPVLVEQPQRVLERREVREFPADVVREPPRHAPEFGALQRVFDGGGDEPGDVGLLAEAARRPDLLQPEQSLRDAGEAAGELELVLAAVGDLRGAGAVALCGAVEDPGAHHGRIAEPG